MKNKTFKQYFATLIVIVLALFLSYTAYRFVNGFFGALLLYVVLFPLHHFLIKKNINKRLATGIVIFVAFFAIIIPLLLILGIIGNEVIQIFNNPDLVENTSNTISESITQISPSLSKDFLVEKLTSVGSSIPPLLFNTVTSTGTFVINLVIAFFLLYFMFVQGHFFKKLQNIIPFNENNSLELVNKIKDVSRSTVLVGGIIALIQGALLTIAFLIFGVKGAFLWGFVTAVLSFLPIIGPPVVWIPASIILFFQGNYWAGTGIVIFGLLLSNIDNLIRPYLGKSIAKIHPLVTLIGIFIGIPLFGLIGIFVGPLLIAYSVLVLKSYKEEYID